MRSDARGLAVTTDCATAVAHCDRAVHALLAHRADLMAHLEAALAADPGLVVAHVLAGFALQAGARAALLPRAGGHLAAARETLDARGGTAREHRLVQALAAWHRHGDMHEAAAILERQLLADPHDLPALKLAHGIRFMLGDAVGMRLAIEHALPAWTARVPGFGYLLGCHAFALEETHDADAAERIGREACMAASDDLWGAHAVAHVMERQGRAREGIAWIRAIEGRLAAGGAFGRHVHWHAALFHLHRGDTQAALDLHDRFVASIPADDVRDFANAASLLWRLAAQGVAVPRQRWDALAAIAARPGHDAGLAFFDLHQVLALAQAGDAAGLAAKVAALHARATRGIDSQARVLATAGLPAARAVIAAGQGQDAEAIALLLPLRGRLGALGGSDAQRDLLDRLLIHCAINASEAALARRLLDGRAALRAPGAWEAACRQRLARGAASAPVALAS
jgi:hypothetical protein